ncbi:TlpA family protein disulfide reductase [Aquirufa novilacunae]|jgi:thiol-disulfide isomerase/thioredoxin|uniref:TlpA disulfide reductase family protein n=1 Tax=Aquirufa novilacunae TaxID=3139305 RepID=A0ABW8U6C8_9BACT
MKLLGYLLLFATALQAQNFELRVQAKTLIPGKKIYLEYVNEQGKVVKVDSATPSAEQKVSFKGQVKDQGAFYLVNFFDTPKPQKVLVILEGGETIDVEADGVNDEEGKSNFTLKGDYPNVKFMLELMAISKEMEKKVRKWNQEIQVDPKQEKRIQAEFTQAQAASTAKIKELIPQMGSHLVALWATNFLPAEKEMASLEDIANRLAKARPNHPQVKQFVANLQRLQGVNEGAMAPEINLATPEGPNLALSSLRGKYVLIDFWASWCGPCRRENPNVVKTYAAYKDKGFEIYGVSLDQDREAWLKAIEKDQLVWKHVSDLKYWSSAGAQAYQVNSIPQTFLLDKEGRILAKGLRGAALDQYLAQLFKDK